MSTDYKIKYLKYKKKYLDLKSNIDQTSGSNKDKDLILSGTFEIGEFKKRIQQAGDDRDSYNAYFGELFKKEKNGKAVNYEIYFRENKLHGNLKRDKKEMKLHIKFSNEGDMLNKKIYVIDEMYYHPSKSKFVCVLHYAYTAVLGEHGRYDKVAELDFKNAKKKNMVNYMKNGGAISEDDLFSPDTIYDANPIGKKYNNEDIRKMSKGKLREITKRYKEQIIENFGIPEGWEKKYDKMEEYYEYQNNGTKVFDIVEHLEAKASKR